MSKMNTASQVPTAANVLKDQRERHGTIVPAAKLPTVSTGSSPVAGYLAEHGVGQGGTPFKLTKDGKFCKTMDDEEISEGTELVVVYDQIQGGWIKFNGKGNPPTREMGPLFDGFVVPARDTLGDTDESQWETGLDGKLSDPWQHQLLVPMFNPATDELLIFGTTSLTGRREVSSLIRHCDRMRATEPDKYPVIRLQAGGFQHKNERIGWVKTPKFPVVGKAPKINASAADTSLAGDLNDELPW
jgi:hypothetical protein